MKLNFVAGLMSWIAASMAFGKKDGMPFMPSNNFSHHSSGVKKPDPGSRERRRIRKAERMRRKHNRLNDSGWKK